LDRSASSSLPVEPGKFSESLTAGLVEFAVQSQKTAAARSKGRRHIGKRVRLDPRVSHLWRWFLDLSQARQSGMNGPGPITYAEIAAYATMMKEIITPWEVAAIRRVDDAVLDVIAQKRREARRD
jgi:hypothetical protein